MKTLVKILFTRGITLFDFVAMALILTIPMPLLPALLLIIAITIVDNLGLKYTKKMKEEI